MRNVKLRKLLAITVFPFLVVSKLSAQDNAKNNEALSNRQQAIVAISAFTANGDIPALNRAVSEGLDAGLPVNDMKEIMVQLYAYAGFPRSLNALNTLMDVLQQRKQKGINDPLGKMPAPLPANKSSLQSGAENQTRLLGRAVSGDVYRFAPLIDQFLKAHLFGDIFGRDNLDWKTRELATISALAALGGAESQLRAHFGVGLFNGLTESQLHQVVAIIQGRVGPKEGATAAAVLQAALRQRQGAAAAPGQNPVVTEPASNTIFPLGEKVSNDNFTGMVYLNMLLPGDSILQTQVGTVSFAPGARTRWHQHPTGQIILVTGGTGYYQEKGSAKRIIRKGDMIKCPENAIHWHGATEYASMTHIVVNPNTEKGSALWLHPVSDEEYTGGNQ